MKTTRRILFLLTLLTAPSWVSAQINNYVMLDGINDYINLPGSLSNYTTSSAGTVSMWIRPTGASPTMFYAYEGNSIFADQGGYMGISRGIIGGQDRIWFYNWSGGYSQVGIPYNADEWIHIAWVLEGSYLKAYKNGALVDSIATGPTSYLGYGAKIGLYYNYFLGLLDEANTWNRALTPSEVFSIYQSGLVGNESGLTALWHLDEGGGTIVEDATVNNYDGTLVGGVSFGPLSGLQAKVGDQKVTLLWNHSTEIDVLRYRIFRDTLPNPVVQIDSTTDSTITYTGLTNFKKYYFRVTIVDVSLNDTGYAGVSATPTNFSEVTGTGFINGADGNFMWGDYDNDGDYDVAIVGATDEYYPPFQNGFAKLYRHDNGDTFTEIDAQFQQEIHRSSVTWTDFNNDGLLDLAYAGSSGSGSRTLKLYKNNGNGTFSDVLHNMAGTALSAMAWGDYDNDGDQDLFLMGNDAGSGSQGSFLYRNDGNGEFNLVDTGIPGHANGSCAWGDYDNDNDLDLLVLGDGAVGFGIFLYRNDGNDSFADISANLPVLSIYRGQAVWGDYDNDGDLDIAFSGSTGGSGTRYASVYENNGDDTFTDINPGLTGLARAAVVWGDFDNDGDLDLFMTGTPTDYTGRQSYIARNNGGGSFVMIDIGIEPIFGGDQYTPGAAFIDYDRDGDLDVMVEGVDINNNYVTKLYKNGGSVLNVPPSDPTNLATTTSLDTVSFSWNKSTDNETPQNGLTYNLRVGKTPAGVQVMPPLAKVVDSGNTGGFRLIQAMGNTGHSNSWKLWDLADGTYYWSVESIDQIYRNSKFQAEQSFTIDGIPSAPIGLVAASNVSSVNLQWSPVNKSDVTKYYIWASDNNDTYYLADSTATTGKTITTLDGSTPLQNGAIYYFYIMAVDNNGYESPYSSTVSAIPSATPGKWFVTHPGDDSEGGTLREIIDSTNLSTQSDTIVFKIPRGSVISLYSSLQAISTDFTVIDGDSNADGIPDIMVVNSSFGDVMTVTSSNNLIKGLVIGSTYGTGGGGAALTLTGSDAHDNRILGNYIGTDMTGSSAATTGSGIYLSDGAHDNWIGDGTLSGGNVISGNANYGIEIYGWNAFCDNNKILGNIIGLSADGLSAVPNSNYGIYIYQKARNTQIGNATAGGRNIISSNLSYGIYIEDSGGLVSGTSILGNYIGTDVTGMVGLGNGNYGIYLYGYYGGGGESIINTAIGNGTAAGRNVISGNGSYGIYFQDHNVHDNSINGNYIGLTADGAETLANQYGGIYLDQSGDNSISNNVVSGNDGTGITITSGYNTNADDNVIRGNKIGTDATGSFAIGNSGYGIHLQAGNGGYSVTNTIIGGTSAGEGNIISGNTNSAIVLGEFGYGFIKKTEILGNFIGTNASGSAAIPNDGHGIYIYSSYDSNTAIGNGTAGGRNVISGNKQSGIWLEWTSYNTVLGNYVGVDATGNTALPNDSCGIVIWNSSYNRIGDGTAGGRNIVSANAMEGIELYAGSSNNASYNYIGGNYVGIGADGITALGNGGHGIEIEARDVGDYTYNDTVFANVIAFNGEDGIHMESNPSGGAYDNPLLGNSIFSNGGEGIAFENGANYGVLSPVIDSVINFTVYGHGIPDATVEVHADSDDEGQFIIGQTTADGSGAWSLAHNAYPGQNITAIQDSVDNTSAFSAAVAVTSGNLAPSAASLNFGIVYDTDSLLLPVRIWATGNPVIVTSTSVATAHYTITGSSLPDTLYAGDTITFTVKFKPSAVGSLTDTLKFNNGSTVNPFKIILSGTGKTNTAPNTFNVKPMAGALTNDLTPTLTWEGRGDVDGDSVKYTLVVSTNSNLSSPQVNQSGITDTTFTLSSNLNAVALYYWRVTATDTRGGSTLSNTGFFRTDAQAPVAAIGALTLKVVPIKKYLQVYVATSEKLKTDTVRFILNNVVDNSHTLSAVGNNVYSTEYALTVTGTLVVRVTGTDSAGNFMNQTQNYNILTVSKNEALAFNLDGLELSGTKGSVDEDGFMLVSRTGLESTDHTATLLSQAKRSGTEGLEKGNELNGSVINSAWVQIGAGVEIISTVELKKALTLKLSYTEEELTLARVRYPDFDERKVGIYREENGNWVYEGGQGSGNSITMKLQKSGSLTMFYNPTHEIIPTSLELSQNYPNPFNPSTTIKFGLPDEGRVKLVIYNILGQRVKELLNETRGAGYHTAIWNGKNETGQQVSSGLYIYRLESAKGVQSKKMLLIK